MQWRDEGRVREEKDGEESQVHGFEEARHDTGMPSGLTAMTGT
jgi:hypothetical protein